jgi:hypothetical protein
MELFHLNNEVFMAILVYIDHLIPRSEKSYSSVKFI